MTPVNQPLRLLGGLSPQAFMRRHWHKRPLLIRSAVGQPGPPVSRTELFRLAARDDVQSRLVMRQGRAWSMLHGPFPRRSLPPVAQPAWTLLVQGLDHHVAAARELRDAFGFVPRARLDDVMVSWASDRGGVGPHFDSYDVFLLQVQGRRRWRIGRMQDARLRPNLPVKILARFEPEEEWVLEPGDMLYLPPRWAHDGTAVGECMTCSIGFRAPSEAELMREVLARMADEVETEGSPLYADPRQPATATPGRMPDALPTLAERALRDLLRRPGVIAQAVGEYVTEPKPQVWFVPGAALPRGAGVRLDARSCMIYDDDHVYLNGESWRAAGADARVLRRLADEGMLDAATLSRASAPVREAVRGWVADGWLRAIPHEEI